PSLKAPSQAQVEFCFPGLYWLLPPAWEVPSQTQYTV
ncbi:hypothetical protein A2U01_0115237, partial [Trifolium medium]|nr:hypothetical protein [Trifolium medium]